MARVTFLGAAKLIIVNTGETVLDVQEHLYSEWKRWVLSNGQYPAAFSVLGGDPLPGGIEVGRYFFLEGGWRIRPQESNHTLNIQGNLFTRDGSNPFAPTLGAYNVTASILASSLAQAVQTGGSSADPAQIAEAVMDALVEQNFTLREAQRVILAVLAGKSSGFPSAPYKIFRDVNDTRDTVTAQSDAQGNRSQITIDTGL